MRLLGDARNPASDIEARTGRQHHHNDAEARILDRLSKRSRGLHRHKARHDDQQEALDDSRNMLDLLVPKRMHRIGRPIGSTHRQECDHRSEQIRERMSRLGQNRRRPVANATSPFTPNAEPVNATLNHAARRFDRGRSGVAARAINGR